MFWLGLIRNVNVVLKVIYIFIYIRYFKKVWFYFIIYFGFKLIIYWVYIINIVVLSKKFFEDVEICYFWV